MEFYKVLESLMEAKNLSIPDISRSTGLSDSTLRSIISRKTKNISLEVAFKLSEGLNVTLEELNGDSPKVKQPTISEIPSLSKEEQNHIEEFRELNDLGRKKVISYTKDLIEMPKYQKELWKENGKEYLMPIASHEIDGEFTEEDYKHDDDLMKDDDLWNK